MVAPRLEAFALWHKKKKSKLCRIRRLLTIEGFRTADTTKQPFLKASRGIISAVTAARQKPENPLTKAMLSTLERFCFNVAF